MRLEHSVLSKSLESLAFQFHKGAIRTFTCEQTSTLFRYFNSIKVRLEPSVSVVISVLPSFQFHKGAIRTLCVIIPLKLLAISIP